jgi:hypothetical protein
MTRLLGVRPASRFTGIVVSAMFLAGAIVGITAQSAHAATPLLCVGTETASFSPPLTNTPRLTTVSATEDLDYCPLGGVTTGSASGIFQVTASCTGETLTPTAITYRWNTGQSSAVNYTATSVTRLADGSTLVVSVGTVTGGFDQGAAAETQIVDPVLNLTLCSGSGVSQVTGPETLTFI